MSDRHPRTSALAFGDAHGTAMPPIAARRVPAPAVRLLWFHHAGGSGESYRSWARLVPSAWEVVCVEYPGRGARAGAPLAHDMPTLAEAVMADVAPLLDRPYALFGHSMGSLVAFEVARRVRAAGLPAPLWLGVSGRGAPHRPPRSRYLLHKLSDDALWDAVCSMGATPAELFRGARERASFVARLRADLTVCETYRPAAEPGLDVPVAAYAGAEDPMLRPGEAGHWAELTASRFHARHFPGGHFYLLNAAKHEVSRQIVADVIAARDGAAAATTGPALLSA